MNEILKHTYHPIMYSFIPHPVKAIQNLVLGIEIFQKPVTILISLKLDKLISDLLAY